MRPAGEIPPKPTMTGRRCTLFLCSREFRMPIDQLSLPPIALPIDTVDLDCCLIEFNGEEVIEMIASIEILELILRSCTVCACFAIVREESAATRCDKLRSNRELQR